MHLMETLEAYQRNDPAARSKLEVFLLYNGVHAILMYRLSHWLWVHKLQFLARMLSQIAKWLTGVEIHPAATIGRRLVIDHGTGIVIGETSEIGEHAKIYQGVTLGALSTRGGQKLKGKKRHPTIEDDVTIYSGASILGGETVISEGAVIGGNAFVTKSVPEQTRVSAKMPELQFKRHENVEFQSGEFLNYEI